MNEDRMDALMHMSDEMYMSGGNDQPTCCPKCGTRTEFIDQPAIPGEPLVQTHSCPACRYLFVLEVSTVREIADSGLENRRPLP